MRAALAPPSSLYYEPARETGADLRLMRLIDEQYAACPFNGNRRMTAWLIERGEEMNRKQVRRLMRLMGLEEIYPKPRLSPQPQATGSMRICCVV